MAKDSNAVMQAAIKKMSRCMFWRNLLLHPTRNSLRHTNKYYHRFIGIIGKENYDALDPALKNAWEGAKNSFDAMYGLAAAWKTLDFRRKEKQPEEPKPFNPSSALMEQLNDYLLKLQSEIQKLPPAGGDTALSTEIHAAMTRIDGFSPLKAESTDSPEDARLKAMITTTATLHRTLLAHNLCTKVRESIKE